MLSKTLSNNKLGFPVWPKAPDSENTHLHMAIQGCVVQGRAPASVRDVDAAEQRDDHFRTLDGLVGRGHVQGRLPVLVPRVDIG